ncbi:MAG: hypothetical protein QOD75_131 [Blastocatellia bacterium]|jgi:hypothetical protein|nr:hypothetical protein [Blastocatellia bacterium]
MAKPNSTTSPYEAVNTQDDGAQSAIGALIKFAAQRSGIERNNYYSPWDTGETLRHGRRAFQQEQQSIRADLRRFREAIKIAAAEGVTDADVLAEAPHAFSGRLQWKSHKAKHYRQTDPAKYGGTHKGGTVISEIELWDWEYCAGQYFPTEYRKAAATLLEAAIRRVRQARPSETAEPITTISQLKALNERNGGSWFERSTMRFFGTRIESGIIRGGYFITSDKRGFEDSAGRGFTIRQFNDEGSVHSDVGDLAQYNSKDEALEALKNYLNASAPRKEQL